MMWRHGDILIAGIESVPKHAKPMPGAILAHGEVTGHSHRMETPEGINLWSVGETIFLQVVEVSAKLIHEEHAPIELPRGFYRVWRQREYTPTAIVRVSD
jgi:hypothetical protein